jgi:hypothetical protein
VKGVRRLYASTDQWGFENCAAGIMETHCVPARPQSHTSGGHNNNKKAEKGSAFRRSGSSHY